MKSHQIIANDFVMSPNQMWLFLLVEYGVTTYIQLTAPRTNANAKARKHINSLMDIHTHGASDDIMGSLTFMIEMIG